jgi:hypothetical protein
MVPFSFPQTLLKSRVMQKYLAGVSDDEMIGSSVTLVAHGIWNQALLPFPAFLLSLWSFRPGRKTQ